MDPWPSFYFCYGCHSYFQFSVYWGWCARSPASLCPVMFILRSGEETELRQSAKSHIRKNGTCLRSECCCGTWKADLRMSQKCQHVHCVSLCWTSSILCSQDLSYQERECLRYASVLCVVDLSTWWCRYTCLLFTDLSSSLFLVWMHSLWMVYYSFLGCRALGTPWLFSSVFLLWLGIVTFWKLF